jgi:integrase
MKERAMLATNPMAMVRRPRVFDARERVMTAEEWGYLMQAARDSKAPWLAPALTVLTGSAMRRSELFGLKRQDVDHEARTAYLADTKNGRARYVPLCPEALGALQDLDAMAAGRGDDQLIPVGAVGSMSTRFQVTVGRARSRYLEDCQQQGRTPDEGFLKDLRLHDLRHHAISAWASTGQLSLHELMLIAGHANPRMVPRYTHLKAGDLSKKLAGLVAGGVQ